MASIPRKFIHTSSPEPLRTSGLEMGQVSNPTDRIVWGISRKRWHLEVDKKTDPQIDFECLLFGPLASAGCSKTIHCAALSKQRAFGPEASVTLKVEGSTMLKTT